MSFNTRPGQKQTTKSHSPLDLETRRPFFTIKKKIS
jgi:hypothetical protein